MSLFILIFSLSYEIELKYPKSQYITHFYDKKTDTIIFSLSKQQFDTIQILYKKYVTSYPNDTEIYLKNNSFETLAYETKYHFDLKNRNSKRELKNKPRQNNIPYI